MIYFYNTLTKKKEVFNPIKNGHVKLYTCGPTVYDYAHIGNFRAYIFEDLLRRFLEFKGFEVLHVMNITDVDDKTIASSISQNIDFNKFTKKYTNSFLKDVDVLKIRRAHHYPCATDFINQMIDMIKLLEKKGFTYTTEDKSVFFKIKKYKDYGVLANLDLPNLKIGDRVTKDEYGKEAIHDFALWKGRKQEDGQVFWDSPWGEGRPGWHIECSCMSTYYLGDHFDIHCGGVDNIFPHHENEIAQSCAALDTDFVNYWMHNEHLKVENQKMSKSLGNFYTLRDLLKLNYSAESIRYTLISTHYRQKLNFTFQKLKDSQKAINRLRELSRRLDEVAINGKNDENINILNLDFLNKFSNCLSNDLNISGALGELSIWVNSVFKMLDGNLLSKEYALKAQDVLKSVDEILGVIYNQEPNDVNDQIKSLINERNKARDNNEWDKADLIRDKLLSQGIVLEDTPNGTVWKKK